MSQRLLWPIRQSIYSPRMKACFAAWIGQDKTNCGRSLVVSFVVGLGWGIVQANVVNLSKLESEAPPPLMII